MRSWFSAMSLLPSRVEPERALNACRWVVRGLCAGARTLRYLLSPVFRPLGGAADRGKQRKRYAFTALADFQFILYSFTPNIAESYLFQSTRKKNAPTCSHYGPLHWPHRVQARYGEASAYGATLSALGQLLRVKNGHIVVHACRKNEIHATSSLASS